MTYTYPGLRRAFPYVELNPIKSALRALTGLSTASPAFVDSPMVILMLMLMLMLIDDADDDGDASVDLLKVPYQTSRYDTTHFNGLLLCADRYVHRRWRLITCK